MKLIFDQANSRRQGKSGFPWGPAVTDGEPPDCRLRPVVSESPPLSVTSPAPPRCEASRVCPRATKEHKVKWPTQHYYCALLWINITGMQRWVYAIVALLCLLILLAAFELIRIIFESSEMFVLLSQRSVFCWTCVSWNISAAFTNLKLNIYQVYSNFKCINFNGQILKATIIIYIYIYIHT